MTKELYPNSTMANRAVYAPGETVTLAIKVKNTGSLGVAPFYRLEVTEAAGLYRTKGSLVLSKTGQTAHIAPGAIATITFSYTCKELANLRRDVFFKLWHDRVDGSILLADSGWAWEDAFAVEKAATKLEIMDLTLS